MVMVNEFFGSLNSCESIENYLKVDKLGLKGGLRERSHITYRSGGGGASIVASIVWSKGILGYALGGNIHETRLEYINSPINLNFRLQKKPERQKAVVQPGNSIPSN